MSPAKKLNEDQRAAITRHKAGLVKLLKVFSEPTAEDLEVAAAIEQGKLISPEWKPK